LFGVIIDPNGYGYKNHIKAKLVSFYHHVPFWLFLYTFGGTPQKNEEDGVLVSFCRVWVNQGKWRKMEPLFSS